MAPGVIFAKGLYYICTISSIRRSRCGRVKPNLFSNTFWASSGAVAQQSPTVFFGWPSLARVGKTRPPLLILKNSPGNVPGTSPNPARFIH